MATAPLGNQAASTMTGWCRQHHSVTLSRLGANHPCPILIMSSTWLGSNMYQFDKSLVWLDRGLNPWSPSRTRDQCSTTLQVNNKGHVLRPTVANQSAYSLTTSSCRCQYSISHNLICHFRGTKVGVHISTSKIKGNSIYMFGITNMGLVLIFDVKGKA